MGGSRGLIAVNDILNNMVSFLSASAEETFTFAYELGRSLAPVSVLCFFGELGAGKTTFIKGLLQGAIGLDPQEVQSPTFAYLNVYEADGLAFHFDLYRLKSAEEFLSMGFDDYFEAGICCIEWSERIASILPAEVIKVTLEHQEKGCRLITIRR